MGPGVDRTRFCGRPTVISGEGGESFSRDRIWILLATDGELATAQTPARLAAAGAGWWVRLAAGRGLGPMGLSYALPP